MPVAALAVALVYPYAKRYVSMPQAVLGVAFSFGSPMAFAAVRGGPLWQVFSAEAWANFSLATWWASVPPLAWLLLLVFCVGAMITPPPEPPAWEWWW